MFNFFCFILRVESNMFWHVMPSSEMVIYMDNFLYFEIFCYNFDIEAQNFLFKIVTWLQKVNNV